MNPVNGRSIDGHYRRLQLWSELNEIQPSHSRRGKKRRPSECLVSSPLTFHSSRVSLVKHAFCHSCYYQRSIFSVSSYPDGQRRAFSPSFLMMSLTLFLSAPFPNMWLAEPKRYPGLTPVSCRDFSAVPGDVITRPLWIWCGWAGLFPPRLRGRKWQRQRCRKKRLKVEKSLKRSKEECSSLDWRSNQTFSSSHD